MSISAEIDAILLAPKPDRNHGLGRILRTLRKARGLTQVDLANQLGIERTSVCNIETGTQPLTVERLEQIAQLLSVEIKMSFTSTSSVALQQSHRLGGAHE